MVSMMACVTILASGIRCKISYLVLKGVMIGDSRSSAELSKNEITALSAVRKIDTSSTPNPRLFDTKASAFSRIRVVPRSFRQGIVVG